MGTEPMIGSGSLMGENCRRPFLTGLTGLTGWAGFVTEPADDRQDHPWEHPHHQSQYNNIQNRPLDF
jgi:hypothetical protein